MEYRRCNEWSEEDRNGRRVSFFCALRKGHPAKQHSQYFDARHQGVRLGPTVTLLDKDIARLRQELSRAEAQRRTHAANIRIKCLGWTVNSRKSGCGKFFRVSTLTYIQTHWYTPPFSCSGGDYWNQGEGQFVCPGCGAMNRLYERPEVEKMKHLFASTEDTH